jgi:hypothetical protein
MDQREHRGRDIQDRIGRILYEDWDPLGLRGVAPSDEYDSYIGGVYRLLARAQVARRWPTTLRNSNVPRLAIPKPPRPATWLRRRSCANSTSASKRHRKYAGADRFHTFGRTLFVITAYQSARRRRITRKIRAAYSMLADLTTPQRQLADYMSDLSEEAYYAGWMEGLEYALWDALTGRLEEYGRLQITEAHRTRLRELSEGCAGWIIFDQDTGETWIPTRDWEQRFSAWRSRRPTP